MKSIEPIQTSSNPFTLTSTVRASASVDDVGEREMDFFQNRDLDLILTERATRFYDPKLSGIEKEKCILVAVDTKLETRRAHVESAPIFSLKESLR